jgi:hypothetical protein
MLDCGVKKDGKASDLHPQVLTAAFAYEMQRTTVFRLPIRDVSADLIAALELEVGEVSF